MTEEDIEELRRQGLSDAEVLDIAMTAGARSLFSKVLDAVGAEPEKRYDTLLEAGLRETLTVGRVLDNEAHGDTLPPKNRLR